ncbi:MAG: phosphoenolpyruvate--protein phosphotransferase [Melioribacteraceae bacterium]|nr:MAG: phosphoenolpyruvate--protein phosphotransferase [Melioribacteraceae bacterium]
MQKEKSNIYKGLPAAPGITIAPAYLFKKEKESINSDTIENVEEAITILEESLESSRKELKKVFGLAIDKLGEKRAAIFEAQIMILDDPVLIDTIKKRIRDEKRTSEYIVYDEISKYQRMMDQVNEPYMKERSQDIDDIKNRIIRNIKKKKWKSKITNDVIVVTDNITPADTVLFSRANVKGYVTNFGGLTSHAAIVARSLHIPAVLGLHDATAKINDGDTIIVDGYRGEVVVAPTDEQLSYYKKRIKNLNLYDAELSKLKDLPAETTDGRRISLLANLDLTEEIDLIVQNGANGIGLVRTEQIFEEMDQFPTEEVQLEWYKQISENIYPDIAIIRVLDIGGDKILPVDVKEANPFLGWRGIRFLLDNRELFKTQLRAILRASIHKNIKVMLPMIASLVEVRETKKIMEGCKAELKKEGHKFDNDIELGIMIEVPSAAVLAHEFAKEVSFFSIGTNDLIQYLLAVDRGNEIVSSLYQEFHPSVVRTIDFIIKEGKQNDVFVSICGEMASDQIAIPLLIGLGLDSLSVSPALIPVTKQIIRNISFEETQKLVEKCLTAITEKDIKDILTNYFDEKVKHHLKSFFVTN